MFPLLSRCNEFAGTPMKALLDGPVTKRLAGGKYEGNNCRKHVQKYIQPWGFH
jgi:hypothetical protein